MEGRSSREGLERCANHLESSSRPTLRTSLKGTPSLSVNLAPLLVLHAASSWGHLTYRTECGLKPLKSRYTSRIARQRTSWTERHHLRYGKIKKLGNLLHMHEWGALAFKHVEARFRSNKLAARAMKLYLVGYNTQDKTCRLWDPGRTSLTR